MPLRNAEKAYNKEYSPFRGPHQLVDGPDQHANYTDIVVAYANLLEERIYVMDLELSAMRDRFGHQLDFTNMSEPDGPTVEDTGMPSKQVEPAIQAVKSWDDIRKEQSPLASGGLASNATHPWDMPVVDAANPSGVTARDRMMQMALENADLRTQVHNLQIRPPEVPLSYKTLEQQLAAVRSKNTELETINRGLRGDLAGCSKALQDANAKLEFQDRHAAASPVSLNAQFMIGVRDEVQRLWGEMAFYSTRERALRFLEEAVELVQACNVDIQTVGKMANYVYGRPVGEFNQEIGGVMVTLAALCGSHSVDMFTMGVIELGRLRRKTPDEMRVKHKSKPPELRAL